ncbi:hypothetical protein Aduo_003439 [Ancylostoma duodenale]
MAKKLREADEDKAQPGQISLNYQGEAKDGKDNAPKEFFLKVDHELLRKPGYSQYIDMRDNFHRKVGIEEPRVSREEEKREIKAFLNTTLASGPWQILYDFFNRKGHPYAENQTIFRKWIKRLWFKHYSRSRGKLDSSSFEHVFIGEEKKKEVSGLHNWVRLYLLERNRTENFDYQGYILQRGNIMAALKFTWQGALKRTGSLPIGTSPQYDMALYTLCFLSRRGKEPCQVELDGCPLSVTSYDLLYIGTVYPTAGKKTSTCGV